MVLKEKGRCFDFNLNTGKSSWTHQCYFSNWWWALGHWPKIYPRASLDQCHSTITIDCSPSLMMINDWWWWRPVSEEEGWRRRKQRLPSVRARPAVRSGRPVDSAQFLPINHYLGSDGGGEKNWKWKEHLLAGPPGIRSSSRRTLQGPFFQGQPLLCNPPSSRSGPPPPAARLSCWRPSSHPTTTHLLRARTTRATFQRRLWKSEYDVRFLVAAPEIRQPIFEAIAAVTTVESIAQYM